MSDLRPFYDEDGLRPLTRIINGVSCYITQPVACYSCGRENLVALVYVDEHGATSVKAGPRECGCRARALVAMQRAGLL